MSVAWTGSSSMLAMKGKRCRDTRLATDKSLFFPLTLLQVAASTRIATLRDREVFCPEKSHQ